MDSLYTVICDFRGETYVSQVRAPDEAAAIEAWAERFRDEKPAPKGSKRLATYVLDKVKEHPPTPLEGLSGAWYFAAVAGKHMGYCRLVLTEQPA
jgi:hypothetical protein